MPITSRIRRRTAPLAIALVGVLLATAACSSSSDSSGSADTSDAKAVETAEAIVEAGRKVPDFTFTGDPIDLSALKGKKVVSIPLNSTIPFIQVIESVMERLADKAGIAFTSYSNQGEQAQWVQGIDQAISQKADLVILEGAPNPATLQPQLKRLNAAGIPVLTTHFYNDGTDPATCGGKATNTCPVGVDGLVNAPFDRAAELMANWVIADSGGDANVLVIPSEDLAPSAGMVAAMKKVFEQTCPSCKLSVENVPAADWTTKVASTTQTALSRDPKIDYVVPLYDAMTTYARNGVRTAGKNGAVKVVSYNGTAFALDDIRNGDVTAMDVGENLVWMAYANSDQMFRMLAGMDVVEQKTPLRIFDETDVAEAGEPAGYQNGYGDAFIAGYNKLWGIDTSDITE